MKQLQSLKMSRLAIALFFMATVIGRLTVCQVANPPTADQLQSIKQIKTKLVEVARKRS